MADATVTNTPPPGPLQDLTNTPASLEAKDAEIVRLREMVETLSSGRGRGRKSKKRARDHDDDDSSPNAKRPKEEATDYYAYGQTIGRLLGPFVNLGHVVEYGCNMDTALSGDEEEPNERLDKAWKILCSKFPGFHARLLNLSGDPVTRRAIVKQMTLGADSVRSADTSTVKRGVPKWLLKDPLAPLEPPLPNATSKAHRGLVHPAFATGLTPMTKAANTSTWTQVLEGEIHLTGDQLPGFIFPCGQIFPIDKPLDDPAWADVLENACKGEVCLRSAKAIYQGPEAALEGDGFHKGKPGNASIIGLSTFTPRTVANVITQVRFGLSSMAEWNKMEGDHFDYEEFFWTIHDLFKDEELGASIISLWNKVVFGNAKPSNAGPAASGPSALSIIQAARAAKKAAAAPAAP